jgi:hypothetical protein
MSKHEKSPVENEESSKHLSRNIRPFRRHWDKFDPEWKFMLSPSQQLLGYLLQRSKMAAD